MKATLYSLLMLSLLPIAVSGVAVIQTSNGSVEVEPNASPEQANEVKDSAVKEKIAWGKETDGLVANLRALTTTVKPGEPIEFEIRVKNVSKKDIRLLGHLKPSPAAWLFSFGQWVWTPPVPSLPSTPLKPGDTATVRCLVATTLDSLTAEQKRRLLGSRNLPGVGPFHNVNNKKESVRLPEGVYRVRAVSRSLHARDQFVETNTIDVRIDDDKPDK